MKITEVRLGLISVPLRVPFKTALRSVSSVEDVIVEIHTDTGAVGYGEAPPTGVITGDTTTLDEVSRRLEEDAKGNEDKASFVNLIFLLGLALVISAFGQDIGAALNSAMPFLDKATWTVLLITLSGLIGAVTPVGRMAGSTELSNLLLYSVVALLASRASFLELTDAPAWILAGFMILAIHGIILVLLAKIFHLDMFTCGVASLANIGGSASAPILAGAYSGALVPVGVLMALMGYVIGTAGGLITANIMALLA